MSAVQCKAGPDTIPHPYIGIDATEKQQHGRADEEGLRDRAYDNEVVREQTASASEGHVFFWGNIVAVLSIANSLDQNADGDGLGNEEDLELLDLEFLGKKMENTNAARMIQSSDLRDFVIRDRE